MSFEDAWNSRVETRFADRLVAVLGREALLRNKRATGRPKDLVDAQWLEQNTNS